MSHKTYIAAGNPCTPPEELVSLARHSDMRVRRRVAENHKSPLRLLLVLIEDSEPEVRIALALHPNAPPCLLARLARDPCTDVRYELAEMHQLPLNILHILIQDDNPYVAQRARRTLVTRRRYLQKAWEDSGMAHHTIKVFTGGTSLGFETLQLLRAVVADKDRCEVLEYDIHFMENLALSRLYGVRALPTVVVDETVVFVGCPTANDLIDLGIPVIVSS